MIFPFPTGEQTHFFGRMYKCAPLLFIFFQALFLLVSRIDGTPPKGEIYIVKVRLALLQNCNFLLECLAYSLFISGLLHLYINK